MPDDKDDNSIDVALVAFVHFELFDVLVRLLLGLAALLLNDFAQRRVSTKSCGVYFIDGCSIRKSTTSMPQR